MMTIHQPLLISGGTFDKFIMIAGGVLTSAMGTASVHVHDGDIGTVAGVLTGTKPAIVDPALADAGLAALPRDAPMRSKARRTASSPWRRRRDRDGAVDRRSRTRRSRARWLMTPGRMSHGRARG